MIKNLRAVFQCLRNAGLKLSMAICPFWVGEVDSIVRSVTTKEVAPQNHKVAKFLERSQISKIQETTPMPYWIFENLSQLHT